MISSVDSTFFFWISLEIQSDSRKAIGLKWFLCCSSSLFFFFFFFRRGNGVGWGSYVTFILSLFCHYFFLISPSLGASGRMWFVISWLSSHIFSIFRSVVVKEAHRLTQ